MQLTKFSDYALRVLMFRTCARRSAGHHRGDCSSLSGLPRAPDKVVNALTRAGFLTPVRGRSGGVRPARPADEIVLGAVVRATEPDFARVECFSTGNQCVIAGCCRLSSVMDEALDAFLHVLDQHTLASIALRSRDFKKALKQVAREPV